MDHYVEIDEKGNIKYSCYIDKEMGSILKLPIDREKESLYSFMDQLSSIYNMVHSDLFLNNGA